MNRAYLKHIEETLTPTHSTLLALCDYLEATGWRRIEDRQYSKAFDGEPVQVRVPAHFSTTDTIEAFAEIVSVLALDRPLEELLLDLKVRGEHLQESHELTTNHTRTFFNEAGVVLLDDPNGFGFCVRLEPQDALRHAEFLLAHRLELEQLQKDLEKQWGEVALEVKERFEANFEDVNEDGIAFAEATAQDIQRVLEHVSGTDRQGYFTGTPISPAGLWYRAMWNEDGSETTTFEQQWTPFLRVCYELQVQDQEDSNTEAPYDDRTAHHDTDRFRYE